MRFRSKSRLPPTHNQGVLGSSPSGTTFMNLQSLIYQAIGDFLL